MTGSREELIRLIEQLSDADPELRLGQMLTNLATLARGPQPESVWDCEDDELVAAAQRLLTRIQERQAVVVLPEQCESRGQALQTSNGSGSHRDWQFPRCSAAV